MIRQSEAKTVAAPMAIDEVVERHPGEWILLRVTAYDERRLPSHGWIVAHAPSQTRLTEAFAKEPTRSELPPGTSYYVFHAHPRVFSGDAWRAILDRVAHEDDADVRW